MGSTTDGAGGLLGVEGVGRAFLAASTIGFAVTFLVTGGIALLAGAGWLQAVGVGTFAGLWGGPGFGGMLGLVSAYDRADHP